jgi:hypothetical protein
MLLSLLADYSKNVIILKSKIDNTTTTSEQQQCTVSDEEILNRTVIYELIYLLIALYCYKGIIVV